jgi:hypothetical protein
MPAAIQLTSSIICEAIRKCVVLEFDYHGKHRLVAPYCHGVSTRGVEVLRAIQVGGESSSGGFGFGKLWTVAEMTAMRVTNRKFAADDPNYNPNDRGMKEIHCRV